MKTYIIVLTHMQRMSVIHALNTRIVWLEGVTPANRAKFAEDLETARNTLADLMGAK